MSWPVGHLTRLAAVLLSQVTLVTSLEDLTMRVVSGRTYRNQETVCASQLARVLARLVHIRVVVTHWSGPEREVLHLNVNSLHVAGLQYL